MAQQAARGRAEHEAARRMAQQAARGRADETQDEAL